MRKLISLLLTVCLVASLCVGTASASGEAETTETAVTDVQIVHQDYEPVEDQGLDLTGLYTGETYEDLGDVTVAAGETWTVADSCVVGQLEIDPDATVEAEYPVVVFFSQSDTVENGQVIGNVQFVSDYDEVVAILHTNDTHGFLDSEPYVRGLKTQLEQSGLYSLVLAVSAGDLFAGGYAAAHVYEGEYIPYVMAYTYDFMTWGNNDAGVSDQGIGTYFLSLLGQAEGMTTLLANQNASETLDMVSYAAAYEPTVGVEEFVSLYPDALSLNDDGTIDYSAMNLEDYSLEAGDNALPDGALVETKNGTLLGIFGESTQGGSITDAYFSGGFSTTTVAQTMSDELRAEGASAVVMVCHTGWLGADSTETSSNDTNTAQVALNTTGIDAIVDGHTHSVINDGEGWLFADSASKTIVNQANCKGQAIGVMYLYLKDGQVIAKDCENIVPEDDGTYVGIEPDETVQAAVDKVYGRLADDGYTTVYATSEYFLNGERTGAGDVGGGVRANETNLGDLVADGILYTAQKLWDGDPISIALYPGFWVRASIPAGDITLVDALSVFANPLKIYYASYTAEELVSLMTTSCAKIGSENNSMYQVAGLTCTYDPDTFQVVTLTVGDELIYDNGTYLVDEDWTVGCAAEIGGGDIDNVPEGTEIVSSNSDMAKLWCEFLGEADYTIYPDEVSPAGRVVPAT
jgi:2',3'-cyclic-nucleotide 2'-phosphodiesterase (5'-nucleotidase family)